MSHETPYFAYGSNLNPSNYTEGSLQLLGTARLADYRLAFNYYSSSRKGGALNLVPAPGGWVHGALFRADARGWEWLDLKEGHPDYYRRVPITVETSDGPVEAITYIVIPEKETEREIPPTRKYLELVLEGLRRLDLPTSGLEAAVPDDGPDAVFVYGTLMRGQCRHAALGSPECILQATAFGRLYDLGSYPGLLEPTCHEDRVEGEFVRVKDIRSVLDRLDQIEGYAGPGRVADSLFRRERIQVDVGDGRVRWAWTYVYNRPADKRIPSGNWRKHQGTWEAFLERLTAKHCGNKEGEIAWSLAGRMPFCFNPDRKAVAQSLLPLSRALRDGILSERRLAQATGCWAVRL